MDTYIEVVTDANNYQVNVVEYERMAHLIVTGKSAVEEFLGRWGQTVAFIPAEVKGYHMWDEVAVRKYKDYRVLCKSRGDDE